METLYRTESYSGSRVRDLRDIIEYEMSALFNTDIPRYVLESYDLSDDLRQDLLDTLALEDTGEYPFLVDRGYLQQLIDRMVDAVGRSVGKTLRYGLWLAGRDAVREVYGGNADIQAYLTGDAVLSDLGYDGKLYAYENNPQPIIHQ